MQPLMTLWIYLWTSKYSVVARFGIIPVLLHSNCQALWIWLNKAHKLFKTTLYSNGTGTKCVILVVLTWLWQHLPHFGALHWKPPPWGTSFPERWLYSGAEWCFYNTHHICLTVTHFINGLWKKCFISSFMSLVFLHHSKLLCLSAFAGHLQLFIKYNLEKCVDHIFGSMTSSLVQMLFGAFFSNDRLVN